MRRGSRPPRVGCTESPDCWDVAAVSLFVWTLHSPFTPSPCPLPLLTPPPVFLSTH